MQILFGHDVEVAQWVGDRLGTVIVPPYTALGVVDGTGTLRGGAVFGDFTGSNIEVTVYGPGAMQRGVVRAVLHYAFVQLGCLRITARTRRDNRPMRDLLPRLGFRWEGLARRFYGPSRAEDACLYGMLRSDCRWIETHENPQSSQAA